MKSRPSPCDDGGACICEAWCAFTCGEPCGEKAAGRAGVAVVHCWRRGPPAADTDRDDGALFETEGIGLRLAGRRGGAGPFGWRLTFGLRWLWFGLRLLRCWEGSWR